MGERFDGHDFIKEAEAKGASAAVVNRSIDGVHIPQFVVASPLMALAKIAAAHRQEMSCPIIALTGSNGKTTVKEMIATILPQPSHATKGNLNNHIGVPLSMLALNKQHRYAVFELGANHPGEIAHTVGIVQPDVSLINNIAPAHVEGFGSIDGVARSKGEIHQGLSPTGVAIVNDDDAYAHFWDDLIADKKYYVFPHFILQIFTPRIYAWIPMGELILHWFYLIAEWRLSYKYQVCTMSEMLWLPQLVVML